MCCRPSPPIRHGSTRLSSERVRQAVVASTDQSAAVAMMLRSGGGFDPGAITQDVRLVADGRVSPILLWEKHPLVIVGLLFVALLVLLLLRRLVYAPAQQGRRIAAGTFSATIPSTSGH